VPRQRLTHRINLTVLTVALAVTVIDALTKYWARHHLARHAEHVVGPLWFRLQYNTGISFSFDHSLPIVTTVATVVVAVIVLFFALRANRGLPALGFGLLIGGGIANVIDRLAASPHEVTDFIAVGSFPVFNAADVSITLGFVLLLIAALSGERLLAR
jgi:signal peptidase II